MTVRRPPPLLAILGASAITVAVLTGTSNCTGPGGHPEAKKVKHPPSEFDSTINYGAFGTRTQVNCAEGKTLNVSGSNNTLTVRGHCTAVNVLGADNRITVDRVDRVLLITGLNNVVSYRSGDPRVENHGSGNTVTRP